MKDDILEKGYRQLVLTKKPEFIKSYVIDETMSLYERMMLFSPPSPIDSIFVGTVKPYIISLYKTKRYCYMLQKESGKTLFRIRIGTMEKLTRRLLNDGIIYTTLSWGIKYNFYGYSSNEIVELVRRCKNIWKLRTYIHKTGKSHPASLIYALLYRDIKESTNNIIRDIIPNFPLTIREWNFSRVSIPAYWDRGYFRINSRRKYYESN